MADYAEYTGRVTVNLSQMAEMAKIQKVMREGAEKKYSQSKLVAALDEIGLTTSTLIAYFGKIPGMKSSAAAAAIAFGIYSWINNVAVKPYQLDKLLKAGEAKIDANHIWFSQNATKYKQIEFEVAYLEYFYASSTGTRDSTRYIQQATKPDRLQLQNGTWISAS